MYLVFKIDFIVYLFVSESVVKMEKKIESIEVIMAIGIASVHFSNINIYVVVFFG